MPNNGYLIDWKGIERLREDHEMLEKRVMQLESRSPSHAGSGVRINKEFAKVSQYGITPRDISTEETETVLGIGQAELYEFVLSEDGSSYSIEQIMVNKTKMNPEGDAVEVDVYNSSIVPVAPYSFIHISRNFRSGLWMVDEIQTAVAMTSEDGISARSGTTLGSGEARIYTLSTRGSRDELADTFLDITVYSLSSIAVAGNTYITIKRCSLDENWIVDAEDCV